MQNTTIQYKGFLITPYSYLLVVPKKWRPKVILGKDEASKVIERPLFWEKEFESKKQADTYALAQAKMYIDRLLS